MAFAKITNYFLFIVLLLIWTKGNNSSVIPQSREQHLQNVHEQGRRAAITIETNYGNVYDCVDFYEQPAFKHPLLRNHNFHPEMRPNIYPNWISSSNSRGIDANASKIYRLENGGCPSGTVPIRRANKEDQTQVGSMSESHGYSRLGSTLSKIEPGTHFAIVQTKTSPTSQTQKYYGVGANISIWNPHVKANQYSAAQLMIKNGEDSIQIGWMVNPTMYKDNYTHMFIYTNAGESHCFNTYCPGFVLVRSDLPPDARIMEFSKLGHPLVLNFFVYREPKSGNWWLLMTNNYTPIGFWPEKIFTSLNTFGTYIECGGETYSPPSERGGDPPMGNGAYPRNGTDLDAFVKDFSTVNANLQIVDVEVEGTETFADSKKYEVIDKGISELWGHIVVFGGFGG